MSELLDKIKEVQAQVNNCSTLEAKQLLEQAGGDVDLAVALFEEAHPAPVTPVVPAPQPQQSAPAPQPRPEPPHQDQPPRRRRRRGWWIPLVAVGGYLAISGLVVLIMYQATDGFSSFGSTYSYNYKKSSSTAAIPKPTLDEVLEKVGTNMKNCGKFDPINSSGSYFQVSTEDYNNAKYDFNSSTGYFSISISKIIVYPKEAGTYVGGQLLAKGYAYASGAINITSANAAGYRVI